jgi:Terminase RNaseH-like domain
MTASYVIGIDLGQSPDRTAVALIEYDQIEQPDYRVRFLHLFPRGTPYTELPDTISERISQPPVKSNVNLAVDATGPGRPVVDYLREQLSPTPLFAITITGGTEVTGRHRDPNVPKRHLISTTSLILEQRRLRIAEKMRHTDTLVDELLAFRRFISERGSDTYGGSSGSHDDLVFALSLGLWTAENHNPAGGYGNLTCDPNDPRLGPPIDFTNGVDDIYT